MELMKIPLTQGQYASVDDKHYEWLTQWRWYAHYNRGTKTYYALRSVRDGKIWMHRLIMDAPRGKQVDHINHDSLDNREKNLRLCSPRQNLQNSRNSSTFPGTYWNKRTKKWVSMIGINGRNIYLGTYPDPKSAAIIYEFVCREVCGEELICKMGVGK